MVGTVHKIVYSGGLRGGVIYFCYTEAIYIIMLGVVNIR